MFDQDPRVLGKGLHEAPGILAARHQRDRARFRARKEEKFLDDLVQAGDLLQLDLDRFLLHRREVALDQKFFGLQADEGEGRFQFVRRFGGESADLVEGRLEPVEHPVEQPGQVGNLVMHIGDGNSLGQIVGADVVGGFLDQAHRSEGQAAEKKPDGRADHQGGGAQPDKNPKIAGHHALHLFLRGGDHDVGRADHEFRHAKFGRVVGQVGIEDALARDVGNGAAAEIGRAEKRAPASFVDLEIKDRRLERRCAAEALLDLGRIEDRIIGAEMRLNLGEFVLHQQVDPVDQLLFEKVPTGDEQSDHRGHGGQRVPQGQARPERFHRKW